MSWSTQTLAHSQVTGKQKTDTVTRDPETGVTYADPIPDTNPLLIEAKGNIERKALSMNASLVLGFGGVTAFFDAALLNTDTLALTLDTLACSYLVGWNAAALTEEGDRLFLRKGDHEKCVMEGLRSIIAILTNVPTDIPRIRSSVSSLDSWDLPDA